MSSLNLSSLQETESVGHLIGQHLMQGSIVLLSGPLGSGKTTLAKSICAALGVVSEVVISPTYTMVNVYQGRWPIHHVDLYRLASSDELDGFDRDDLISETGVTLVEWPHLLQSFLEDEPQLWIALKSLGEATRQITLTSVNETFPDLFNALKTYEHSRN